jgi:hypothetical protein
LSDWSDWSDRSDAGGAIRYVPLLARGAILPPPLLSHTCRMAMSEARTPGTRAAWPKLAGRISLRRWRLSGGGPGTRS